MVDGVDTANRLAALNEAGLLHANPAAVRARLIRVTVAASRSYLPAVNTNGTQSCS